MPYRDIVELIKVNQIRQGISVKVLANRIGTNPQVITDIRGYRLKVSEKMFDSILKELSVTDLSEADRILLLNNQERAQMNKHNKYLKEKERKNNK